jgi:hypothetical protein
MGPDTRHWQPIVVDLPIVAFEPRPASPYAYRPDTVCDGWSTEDLVVRLASVRGYAHRYSGLLRQDAANVRTHPATAGVAFAVADGVSAAPLSAIGAVVACRLATDAILAALDCEPDRIDWSGLAQDTATGLVEHLGGNPDEVGRDYATTLVAGVIRPAGRGTARATIIQIGDSSAWILRHERFQPVLSHKLSDRPAVVSSGVLALPRLPRPVTAIDVDVPADGVLLVGTDGFGDPLGDGTGLIGQLFANVLAEIPPPLGLAHALDFSRETFDDDRTLLAVWPRAGLDPPR